MTAVNVVIFVAMISLAPTIYFSYRVIAWFFCKVVSAFKKRSPLVPPYPEVKAVESCGGVVSYEKYKESLDKYVAGKMTLDEFVSTWSGWTILEKEKPVTPPWRNPNEPYYGCGTSVISYNCASTLYWISNPVIGENSAGTIFYDS